jgi:hypothetical protein
MKSTLIAIVSVAFGALAAPSQINAQATPGSVNVTIYNDNLGVVREVRTFEIPRGTSDLRVTDVASMINPATVKISFNGSVLEQNYQYDLVSAEKILQRFIDREVQLIDEKGSIIRGTLLSTQDGSAVIRSATGGLIMLPGLSKYQITVDELPGGLITRPTLLWKVQTDRAGSQNVEMTYQTGGMSWQAEYVAVLKDNDTKLDLNAWVNLTNNSGATFRNAQLKLVAGNVNRIRPPSRDYVYEAGFAMAAKVADSQFDSAGLFEYHMYTLQRPTDLMQNESKQIALFDAAGIPVVKRYRYLGEGQRGQGVGEPVTVQVEFKNAAANKLGIPMPMGIVRVNQASGGSVEFVGEDRINHTPRDEKITLTLGQAFDILGETTTTEQRRISDRVTEMSYKVVLKNRKDTAVTIEVERNFWGNWEMVRNSRDYRKINANKIAFDVPVPANSEVEVTYTVRITN